MKRIQRRRSTLYRKILIFLTAMAVLLSNVQMINAEEVPAEEIPSETVLNVITMIDAVPTVEQLQADFETGRNHTTHTAAVRDAKEKLAEAIYDIITVQFHDMLPGSSIQPAEEMCIRDMIIIKMVMLFQMYKYQIMNMKDM